MAKNVVYHYCRLESFVNILKYKTIRLSDIHKLNDKMETKAFLELLKIATTKEIFANYKEYNMCFIQGMSEESSVNYMINAIINQVKNYDDLIRYAVCFSGDGDQLNQWIRYANDGKGVAIGFKTKCLNQIAKKDTDLQFQKVTYIDEKNISNNPIILNYSKKIMNSFIEHVTSNETERLLTDACNTHLWLRWFNELIDDSMFYKHSSFEYEKEWRLILKDDGLIRSGDNWGEYYNWKDGEYDSIMCKLFPNGLQFRSTEDNIISYLDLNFSEFVDDYILDNIVIGPNCKLNINDISQILQHFSFPVDEMLDNDNIRKSKSPYRII